MKIKCPSCETKVISQNISLDKNLAKCDSCDNIFHYSIANPKHFPVPFDNSYISIPKGIEMYRLVNRMDIFINWRKTAHFFTLIFGIFWIVFISIMSTVAMYANIYFIFLVLVPFWFAGFYMLYRSLGLVFNETTISVTHEQIEISHNPIKYLYQKDAVYKTKLVQQVFVDKVKIGSSNNEPIYAYSIFLHLNNNKKIEIISNFKVEKHAKFVEQEIETYLGIIDVETSI